MGSRMKELQCSKAVVAEKKELIDEGGKLKVLFPGSLGKIMKWTEHPVTQGRDHLDHRCGQRTDGHKRKVSVGIRKEKETLSKTCLHKGVR